VEFFFFVNKKLFLGFKTAREWFTASTVQDGLADSSATGRFAVNGSIKT